MSFPLVVAAARAKACQYLVPVDFEVVLLLTWRSMAFAAVAAVVAAVVFAAAARRGAESCGAGSVMPVEQLVVVRGCLA